MDFTPSISTVGQLRACVEGYRDATTARMNSEPAGSINRVEAASKILAYSEVLVLVSQLEAKEAARV